MLSIDSLRGILCYLLSYSVQELYAGAKIAEAGIEGSDCFFCDFIFTAAAPNKTDDLLKIKLNINKYIKIGAKVTYERGDFDNLLDGLQAFVFSKKIEELMSIDSNGFRITKIQLLDYSDKYKIVDLEIPTELPDGFSAIDFTKVSFDLVSMETVHWKNNVENKKLTRISGKVLEN